MTFEVSLFPTLPFLFELVVATMSLLSHDADHSDSVDADEGNFSCCLPRPLFMLFLLFDQEHLIKKVLTLDVSSFLRGNKLIWTTKLRDVV